MGETNESRSAQLYALAKDDLVWIALSKYLEIDAETVRWALEQAAEEFENRNPTTHRIPLRVAGGSK